MEKSTLQKEINLTISEVEPCLKKAEVVIPADAIKKEMNITLNEFAQQATLPGFRQGKVPLAMIRKRYADQLGQELIRQCHIAAFEKIRTELSTDLVTMPHPDAQPAAPEEGKDYTFSLSFEIAPEFKLPLYKGQKMKKTEHKITDKEIKKEIDRYREMYSEFATVKTPAKTGDMLKISFSSDLDSPDDAPVSYKRLVQTEESWCWLNDPEMLPGIIKGLTGVKAGETKELTVNFPEDFQEKMLAGKTGKYKISVIEVQQRVPLKDDEELCKRLNIDSIDALEKQIKETGAARKEYENKAKLCNDALKILADKVGKLDLPPSLLAQTTQMQFRQIANELVKSDADVEGFKKESEKHRKVAETRAKERLINYFIAKKINEAEKISVTQSEIDQRIRSISATYGYKEKDLRQQMENSGDMEELHIDITISKAAEFLVENADFKNDSKTKTEKDKK